RKAQQVELVLVGRKGRDFYKRRPVKTRGELIGLFTRLTSQHAAEIAGPVIEAFAGEQVDAVYVIYNEFKSVIAQKTVVDHLLPIQRGNSAGETKIEAESATTDYL